MLPQDPFILLNFVNTQLRDRFSSLDAFCNDQQITSAELMERLETVGFHYDPSQNQFR